ncbi:MAG: TRAM domain-containing protein [Thermoproteus sp.]|jgi:predicted RNA-binding protein with TRAM domain|uniref:TRAM domain-containing protein n=1 Tax=Thermoproteus sp. CP80 TaxID=1650659 RepID=UPI00074688FD|nr:TRAM domain-containing protein [Thermoproteus sp. CP80]KUO85079.1 MAG: deoxyribonuclease [Thermoproteus sp. CIS_19]KUO86780.1 MAG: deoxyribonuclease [Thermoproteus sp. JCHS_4]MDT7869506.1 TRAM domain-containing protein [Thermoproteus sp.]MDT7882063.1 TRAM domain-containing protein [Thermoproteus sp.]PLC62712.1 deoxyribonuclease [Thermoproteus sp. CP80]
MESEGRRPRHGGRGGPRGPKPVKEGDVIEVDIVEKSRRGDGVAKVEGFIVFVPGAEPGQHVKVQIEKVGGTYAIAKIVQ